MCEVLAGLSTAVGLLLAYRGNDRPADRGELRDLAFARVTAHRESVRVAGRSVRATRFLLRRTLFIAYVTAPV